jgi:hypothetical protein
MHRKHFIFIFLLLTSIFHCAASFGQYSEELPIAAPIKGPQRYPVATYAKGIHLVVWQEGRHGWGLPADTDIRGIRISEDGKVLDNESFPISNAQDFQEMPAIATDGDIFFVVWQDLRNGKDYDIYAARVTLEGKVLDPDGIPVANAKDNQCMPSVSFDGKNFVIAWMDNRDIPQSYHIQIARVSKNGTVLEPDGAVLASFDKKQLGKKLNSDNLLGLPMNSFPKIACKKGECLVGWIQKTHSWSEYPGFVYINTEPQIELSSKILSLPKNDILKDDRAMDPALSIASTDKGYMAIYSGIQGKGGGHYFIVGVLFNGEDKTQSGIRTVQLRPWSEGYKISESISPYEGGFMVVWSEGNLSRGSVDFILKGMTIKDDKMTSLIISPRSGIYSGSISFSSGQVKGLVVYEKLDNKLGMLVVGRIYVKQD